MVCLRPCWIWDADGVSLPQERIRYATEALPLVTLERTARHGVRCSVHGRRLPWLDLFRALRGGKPIRSVAPGLAFRRCRNRARLWKHQPDLVRQAPHG